MKYILILVVQDYESLKTRRIRIRRRKEEGEKEEEQPLQVGEYDHSNTENKEDEMKSSSDEDSQMKTYEDEAIKEQNVEEPGQSNHITSYPHNSKYIQNIFNPSNSFISNNQNDNNNNSQAKITTTPIIEIIRGIGNYEKYHYIELPLVVLPPHPPVEHAPTNGSTTTVPAINCYYSNHCFNYS
ncbi:hypothetical protein ACTFIU_008564 [Dictyostelium citrinum]